jgi:hypothetical protein
MSDNEDEVAKDVEMEDNAEDATVSVWLSYSCSMPMTTLFCLSKTSVLNTNK